MGYWTEGSASIVKNTDPSYLLPSSSNSVHLIFPIGGSLPVGLYQHVYVVYNFQYTFHCYVYDDDDDAFAYLHVFDGSNDHYSPQSTGIGWEVLYISFIGPNTPYEIDINIGVFTSDQSKEGHIYFDNAELYDGNLSEFQSSILIFPMIIVLLTAIQLRKRKNK